MSVKKLLCIGETIHGCKEFQEYRLEKILAVSQQFSKVGLAIESDSVGLDYCRENAFLPEKMMAFLPKIFKTKQQLEIFKLASEQNTPVFGFDINPRGIGRYEALESSKTRQEQLKEREVIYASNDSFHLRDEYMGKQILNLLTKQDFDVLIILAHNLHIGRKSSQEQDDRLRLKSAVECVLEQWHGETEIIAQYARQGTCLENNLSEFSFNITDIDSLEYLVEKSRKEIDCQALPEEQFGHFYGTLRETVSIQNNYDKVAVHAKVSQPDLWKED